MIAVNRKIIQVFFTASVFLLCAFFLAYADELLLNSGEKVEGKVIQRTERFVKVEIEGDVFTYFIENIKKMRILQPDGSVLTFNTPEEIAGTSVSDYFNRGIQRAEKKDFSGAIADFNKAIELNPKSGDLYYTRAVAFLQMGKPDAAIVDLNRAIELNPKSAHIYYYNRGTAYFNKADMVEAINDYTRAIEKKANFAEAYAKRAAAYNAKKNYFQAVIDASKAIDLNPKFGEAYYYRAVAYFNQKKYSKAVGDADDAKRYKYAVPGQFLQELRQATGED
jgi:tetratricopeptide (TPR) repeat protein